MADRSHAMHMTRQLPGMVARLVQRLFELLLTLAGIILIDPRSAALAIAVAVAAVGVPAVAQPLVRESDLRVRNHIGALGASLSGCVARPGCGPRPSRRAGGATPARSLAGGVVAGEPSSDHVVGLYRRREALLCLGRMGGMLFCHFLRTGAVTGLDMLLVYWTLSLPTIGQGWPHWRSSCPCSRMSWRG